MTNIVYYINSNGNMIERDEQPTAAGLKDVFEFPSREVFTYIYNLTQKKNLSGKVIGNGSISVNGESALRRTISGLSLQLLEEPENYDFSWVMSDEIQIFQGIKNLKTSNQIWYFNLGVYKLSSFSASQSVSGTRVNLSAKDKMVMLNGEQGGTFTVDTELHLKENADGTTSLVSIKDIIKATVQLAGIPEEEIHIDDSDWPAGQELLDYRGSSPLYITAKKNDNDQWIAQQLTVFGDETVERTTFELLEWQENVVERENVKYQKVQYGEVAGYKRIDLTYPAELVAKAGETVTSILDKIVNQFGQQWEYFFDIDGHFYFQRKNALLDFARVEGVTNFDESNSISGEWIRNVVDRTYIYEFNNKDLFTMLTLTPKIENIKNDFVIWGARKSITDGEGIPIHARYVIDNKFKKADDTEITKQIEICEELYQMAMGNSQIPQDKEYYRQFFPDILAFWRDIYNPEAEEDPGLNKSYQQDPTLLPFKLVWIYPENEDDPLFDVTMSKINNRTIVKNEKSVTALDFIDIPPLYFSVGSEDVPAGVIPVSQALERLFSLSTQGISATDYVKFLLYEHAYCTEMATISTIPIYSLEPNKYIKVKVPEQEQEISYILSSFSIPLSYNGTMSLTLVRDKLPPIEINFDQRT